MTEVPWQFHTLYEDFLVNFEEYDVQEIRRLVEEEARQELWEEMLQMVCEEVQQKTQQ